MKTTTKITVFHLVAICIMIFAFTISWKASLVMMLACIFDNYARHLELKLTFKEKLNEMYHLSKYNFDRQ